MAQQDYEEPPQYDYSITHDANHPRVHSATRTSHTYPGTNYIAIGYQPQSNQLPQPTPPVVHNHYHTNNNYMNNVGNVYMENEHYASNSYPNNEGNDYANNQGYNYANNESNNYENNEGNSYPNNESNNYGNDESNNYSYPSSVPSANTPSTIAQANSYPCNYAAVNQGRCLNLISWIGCCELHRCQNAVKPCGNQRLDRKYYCESCNCQMDRCINIRMPHVRSRGCELHTCKTYSCPRLMKTKRVREGGASIVNTLNYCRRHKCADSSCGSPSRKGGDYCQDHQDFSDSDN